MSGFPGKRYSIGPGAGLEFALHLLDGAEPVALGTTLREGIARSGEERGGGRANDKAPLHRQILNDIWNYASLTIKYFLTIRFT